MSNILFQTNHLLRQHGSHSDGCSIWNLRVPRQPRDIFWKIRTPTLCQGNMETNN